MRSLAVRIRGLGVQISRVVEGLWPSFWTRSEALEDFELRSDVIWPMTSQDHSGCSAEARGTEGRSRGPSGAL